MQEVLTGRGRTAVGLALLALAVPAHALEFGEVEVLSAIGQRLDARIPLMPREGEWFHVTCLALAPPASGAALPNIGAATLSVERRRDSSNLRIRTREEVNDPAVSFGVTSTCASAPQAVGRTFTALLDPPGAARPRMQRAPVRAARGAQAAARRPQPPPAAVGSPDAPAVRAASPVVPAAPVPAAIAPKPSRSASGFVLKLSSAPIDLSRTRQFDDKSRALLRERLRLLDTDDQVAEMLSMRDNLRRLEARVSELQLKLAAVPQSFSATPKSEPAASKIEPARAKPAAAPEKVEPAATRIEVPAARVEAPVQPVGAAAPKVEATPAKVEAAPPKVEAVVGALESLSGRLIAAGLALLALLLVLLRWLWLRWRNPPAPDGPVDAAGEATVLMEPDHTVMMAPSELEQEQPIEIAPPARPEVAPASRPEIASDAALATRLEENTELLRRRYIEERFPEIRNRAIVLDDPASIVKGARLFYEDGAMPRAVELLRFAIEDRPDQIRPWLALFEIYRLERLGGEYAELAGRFLERHAASEQWPKVRGLGREIDPSNPLYREAPLKSLETIGPREARRNAASVDPITENWLEAPMDFENEVLAAELRRSLMARAAIDERDLVPNPMPALRSVEMFSVG